MKRLLSFILILAMLISCMTLMLASCGEEEVEKENNIVNDDVEDALEKGDIFAERAAVDDGLDDSLDFGGKTLRVVCHNDGYEMFPAAEDINKGDLIKDAKASRNKAVEDKLNCKVELVYASDINSVSAYVSKTILSGTDEFDMIINHVLSTGGMVPKNLFQNWYDIPHVDFTKPWWAASNATELTYDGKSIFAISDMNATAITCIAILVFNKNLANAWDLGNLYDLVLNGKWTYDEMYSAIKDIYIDQDGSGDRSAGDFYGATLPVSNTTNAWLWAFDNPVTGKDEDGVPIFTIKTDKINNIMQTLFDLYYNTTGVGSSSADDFNESQMFLNKQSIMTAVYLGDLTYKGFRNFEDEYGILPFPKWDDYQKDYHSHVYGEHTVTAIPKTVKDTEFVGACAEALAYESWKTLTPTIYEIALKTRYLRDNESKDVLDIIIQNRYFDFGFVYDNWQGFGGLAYAMLREQTENFESYYSKKYNQARIHLKKIVRAFDKLS